MVRRSGPAAFAALGLLALSACVTAPLGPFMGRSELREEVLEPAKRFWTSSKVALLTLSGAITNDSGFWPGQDSTVVQFKDQLKAAEKDPNVRAVVLRIDSPGGDVTASDIIYREIRQFREKRKVPVYAAMMGVAASGAYYISMAADKVYAQPTTVTGSIGVLAMLPKLEPLAKKIGVEVRVIKSGEVKDLGSMWRDFAPGEREILQEIIDSLYGRFLGIVAEGRPNLAGERIRELADGRIFTAQQAEALGLIDGVKHLDEVIDEAKKAAGLKDAKLVAYRKRFGYKGHIYAQGGSTGPQASVEINVQDILDEFLQPRFQYLWAP